MTKEISVGSDPVKLFSRSGDREWAIIKNAGPGNAYVEIGEDSHNITPARGVVIPSGFSLFFVTREMSHIAREQMHAVSDASSAITLMFQ